MSASISPHSGEVATRYEPVIGLEVHVQLNTQTKIFCSCPAGISDAPNSNVCPVCLGLPGALPVLNQQAVELAIRASLALHCRVNPFSRFARKNYFYPDLPKGYQISQYDQPLAEHGWLEIAADASLQKVRVMRVHMEDDAGKSVHDGFRDSDRFTYVDLNRSGTPLIEIVTEPDLRSAADAYEFLTDLKQAMQYANVSECDMEKGQLRCDANVSVRPKGAHELGTKVEIKNLNSFRFARMAIESEIARQISQIEAGRRIEQETRLYNTETGDTVSMRSKEQAHDYRYFPEPDLLPLRIGEGWLASLREGLPELPAEKRARFVERLGLREYDAGVLTASRSLSDFFERVAESSADPRSAANWVSGELLGMLKGRDVSESTVSAEDLAQLIKLIAEGHVSGKMAKEIFAKMFATGESATAIMESEGLRQISDPEALALIVDQVLTENPKQIEQFRSGKTAVIGFLVGQVMKKSKGQANPASVNDLLKERLKQ